MQPALVKTFLPAVGTPFSLKAGVAGSCCGLGSEPTTVCGVGLTVPSAPQPARGAAARTQITTRRRTGRDNTRRQYHPNHETEVVRPGPRALAEDARHERTARPSLRRIR